MKSTSNITISCLTLSISSFEKSQLSGPFQYKILQLPCFFKKNKQNILKTGFDSSSVIFSSDLCKVEVEVYNKMLIGQNKQ